MVALFVVLRFAQNGHFDEVNCSFGLLKVLSELPSLLHFQSIHNFRPISLQQHHLHHERSYAGNFVQSGGVFLIVNIREPFEEQQREDVGLEVLRIDRPFKIHAPSRGASYSQCAHTLLVPSHIRSPPFKRFIGMKRLFWTLLFVAVLLSGGFFLSTSRAATESAPYSVVEKDGAFEIREYQALKLAKVSMPASDPKSATMDGAFMKLFRYIDGGNESGEKIAMTTPVLMRRDAQERSMSFVMPQSLADKAAPKPKGEVSLDVLPPCRVVALRFSGRSDTGKEKVRLEELLAWAKARALTTSGEPLIAYYDPPWTPGPLRRNEILLRLAPAKE